MSEFDTIRPYYDHQVLARLVASRELAQAASQLVLPSWLGKRAMGRWLTRLILRLKTRNLRSIRDCQNVVAGLFETVIKQSIDQLSVSGLDQLSPNDHYLFISNHRDILMDSSLLNYLLQDAGHDTCRMAVGDNLLSNSLDGFDRTDPALLKMLLLAYRDKGSDQEPLDKLLQVAPVVPVSVSYELDPCGPSKAHELATVDLSGSYQKSPHEDLQSMVQGLMGPKGRVRLCFGQPITQASSLEDLAAQLDQSIVANTRLYPTHRYAKAVLEDQNVQDLLNSPSVRALASQLNELPQGERPYLLKQYANIWPNREELGIT